MLAWEDLGEFLDVGEFATEASHGRDGVALGVITGIFEAPGDVARAGRFEDDTLEPRFTCKASEAVAVQDFDRLTIDGQVYEVTAGPRPDGTGLAVIPLALARA